MRISQGVFCHELLRTQRLQVGRLDSRFTAPDVSDMRVEGYYDPVRVRHSAAVHGDVQQLRAQRSRLQDRPGVLRSGRRRRRVGLGLGGQGFPDTSEALRLAFVKNPYMKLFVASGYYDLATPYFATQYTLSHMNLDPQQHAKVSARLLRRRTHDVHPDRVARPVEAGCVGISGERAEMTSKSLRIKILQGDSYQPLCFQ